MLLFQHQIVLDHIKLTGKTQFQRPYTTAYCELTHVIPIILLILVYFKQVDIEVICIPTFTPHCNVSNQHGMW